MGKIVTFYSYKGGSGRSMALANVAWVLASSGAKVLVVDWDLEAPGLHRYFRPFLPDKELTGVESQGVIDLMIDFTQRLATPVATGERRGEGWYEEHANIAKWTKRLLWPSGEDAKTELGGVIDFVPAGRQGQQYAERVNGFDWASFYERYNGGVFVDAMRRSMTTYDWVLIDSRTGVSDTSGICTVQLPDILVVCFTLNYQSIDGSSAVAASALASRKSRGLRILPLPTRLDGNEEKLLKSMLAYAQRVFAPLMDERRIDLKQYWTEMGVPYFSRYAYSEKLAPFEDHVNVSTSTLPAMERLASYITEGKVAKLGPLPEEHRIDALAEFERMPEEMEGEPRALPAAAQSARATFWDALVRAWYRYGNKYWSAALAGAIVVFLIWKTTTGPNSTQSSPSPAKAITALIADAREDLAGGRREHAALLVAEAASRLDPTSVVGASAEPGKQIYEALLALQPFALSKPPGGAPAQTIVFSPNGEWMATAARGQPARLFRFPVPDQETGEIVGYSAVAFSSDSRYLAVGGRQGSLNVLELASGRRVWQWENKNPDSAWVNAVAFGPAGNRLAAGTDRGVIVIATVDPWKEQRVLRQPGGVIALGFVAESGFVVAGGSDSVVRVWSTGAAPVFQLRGHKGPVTTIAFASRNPSILATVDAVQVHVWDKGVQETSIPSRAPGYAALSPDGSTLIATGAAGQVQLWGVEKSVPIATLDTGEARALGMSADGKLLVVGAADRTVRIFDLASRAQLRRMPISQEASAVALSPDARFLALAGTQGIYFALASQDSALPANQVKSIACSQAPEKQLSPEQWKRYFGSEPLRYTCGAAASGFGSSNTR